MRDQSSDSGAVRFLYGNPVGRFFLRLILSSHVDRLAVKFLRSKASRPMVARFTRKNGVPLSDEELKAFPTYRDFFVRRRPDPEFDPAPSVLISPCDSYLSVFPIDEDSAFSIKGSRYRLDDLFLNGELAARYQGGDCLIFRLCASDYHHYCYIDSGHQGENHFIPGALHSVQPGACARYPVYTLNRRVWTLLETDHFGPVVQTAIGALIVGGIVNHHENYSFRKGEEMGQFELAGSTIVLLFERGRISLLPQLLSRLADGAELRVTQGMSLGTAVTPEVK